MHPNEKRRLNTFMSYRCKNMPDIFRYHVLRFKYLSRRYEIHLTLPILPPFRRVKHFNQSSPNGEATHESRRRPYRVYHLHQLRLFVRVPLDVLQLKLDHHARHLHLCTAEIGEIISVSHSCYDNLGKTDQKLGKTSQKFPNISIACHLGMTLT